MRGFEVLVSKTSLNVSLWLGGNGTPLKRKKKCVKITLETKIVKIIIQFKLFFYKHVDIKQNPRVVKKKKN